jgi:hypothetical protein
MEQILHLAKTLYMQYTTELMLGLLACVLILMIIALVAVRRCSRAVCRMTEKTKDVMKLALRQNQTAPQRTRGDRHNAEEEKKSHGREVSRQDEEVFGSVIQEIFS